MLRLPFAVKDLFAGWLERHYPERTGKILGRIRDVRDGQLNDSRFGSRMSPDGVWADTFRKLFAVTRRRVGLSDRGPGLSVAAFSTAGDEAVDAVLMVSDASEKRVSPYLKKSYRTDRTDIIISPIRPIPSFAFLRRRFLFSPRLWPTISQT